MNQHLSIVPKTVRKYLTPHAMCQVLEVIESRYTVKAIPPKSGRLAVITFADYYGIFFLMAITKIHPAQAAGLQVKKIDFSNKTIRIDQRLSKSKQGVNQWVLTPLMRKQCRTFSFANQPLFEKILQEFCNGKNPDAYIFTTPEGTPIDYLMLRNTIWTPKFDEQEIPKAPHIEGQRAPMSIAAKATPETKATPPLHALPGHSNTEQTASIYLEPGKNYDPVKIVAPFLKAIGTSSQK
jgi:hypothetical protein